MKIRVILYILIFILSTIKVKSQIIDLSSESKEYFIIHTDGNEYTINEHIWFKLYCLQSKDSLPTKYSKLAYVELLSPEGFSIARKKILLNQGLGNGELFLSDTLSSGVYTFVVYTNWLKNFNANRTYEKNLLVFNPEKSFSYLKNTTCDTLNEILTCDSVTNSSYEYQEPLVKSNLKIEGLQSVYNTRDKVKIQLMNIDSNTVTKISVSVRKTFNPNLKSPYYSSDDLKNPELRTNSIYNRTKIKSKINYLPENKGILLSGSVLDKNKRPYASSNILLSFVDSVMNVKIAVTDSIGKFHFFLSPNKAIKDLILITEDKSDMHSIFLDNNYIEYHPNKIRTNPLSFNNSFNTYLKDIYINQRISDFYGQSEKESISIKENITNKLSTFYFQPDITSYLNDYVSFNSLEEFFYELLPEVKISTISGQHKLFILSNSTKKFLDGNPAIFIDGVLFNDINMLLALNPSKLERIEVVKSKVFIYNQVFDGIIGVYTNENSLNDIELSPNLTRIEYNLYDSSKCFQKINKLDPKKPFFNNTLFWDSNITISPDSETEVSFFTGDDASWFELNIEGISSKGEIVNWKSYFQVHQKE